MQQDQEFIIKFMMKGKYIFFIFVAAVSSTVVANTFLILFQRVLIRSFIQNTTRLDLHYLFFMQIGIQLVDFES